MIGITWTRVAVRTVALTQTSPRRHARTTESFAPPEPPPTTLSETAPPRHSLDGLEHERVMEELNNFRIRRLGFVLLPIPGSQRSFIRHWESTTPLGGYLSR